MKTFFRVLSLNVVVFLAAGWLLVRLIDMEQLGLARINHLVVPLNYLLDYSSGDLPYDRGQFVDQLLLYQCLERHNPAMRIADVDGLLGFCHFHLGQKKQARFYLERAVTKNSAYFWHLHNLAVIYYEQKEYELAARYAQAALKTDESLLGKVIKASPVFYRADNLTTYNRLDSDGVGLDLKRFYRGKQQMHYILVLSLTQLKLWDGLAKASLDALDDFKMQDWFYNYHLGVFFLNSKIYDRAIFTFLQVLKGQPGFEDAYEGIQMAADQLDPVQKESMDPILRRVQQMPGGFSLREYLNRYPFKLYIY